MKLYSVLLFAALCASCAEDDGGQTPGNSFREPVPETITLDDAVVTYYGDDSYSGVSDLWTLDLAQSSAGQRLVLSLNVTPNPAGVPDPGLLAGTYRMPANSGDMSAGTYNPGYMTEQDRPNGAVMVPAGTYLAGVTAETSDADLLREGACTVEVDADGRMRIEGTLVGTSYLKRYFTYEGTPQFVDGSGTSGSGVPNSNLDADVRLELLSATRIVDKGDSYFLGDESYRHFVFFLADAGIDLSTQWPGGDGELLRIELFVPWDTDPADGIPAGIYTVPDDVPPSGGVYREDIVPYRIVPGYPDKFTSNSGTWYQYMEAGQWVRYARITGGTLTVERPDGRYRITAEFTDGTTEHAAPAVRKSRRQQGHRHPGRFPGCFVFVRDSLRNRLRQRHRAGPAYDCTRRLSPGRTSTAGVPHRRRSLYHPRNWAAKTGLQKPSRQNRAAVAYLAIATVALHRIAVARAAADPVEKSWPPKAGFLLFWVILPPKTSKFNRSAYETSVLPVCSTRPCGGLRNPDRPARCGSLRRRCRRRAADRQCAPFG